MLFGDPRSELAKTGPIRDACAATFPGMFGHRTFDLASGKPWALFGGVPRFAHGKYGRALRHQTKLNTITLDVPSDSDNPFKIQQFPMTILLVFKLVGYSGYPAILATDFYDTTSIRAGYCFGFVSSQLWWFFATNAGTGAGNRATVYSTKSLSQNVYYAVCARRDGLYSGKFFFDGVETPVATEGSASYFAYGGRPTCLSNWNYNNSSESFMETAAVVAWPFGLSDAWLASLSKNPLQILAPPRTSVFFPQQLTAALPIFRRSNTLQNRIGTRMPV